MLRPRLKDIFRIYKRSGFLSLADQFIISGTSFLIMAMLGRFSGPAELGLYSLAFTITAIIITTQDSLILTPYSVFCHQIRSGSSRQYSGSILIHYFAFSTAAAASLLVLVLIFTWRGASGEVLRMMALLPLMLPFLLAREFGRRFSFAHLKIQNALLLDFSALAAQLLGLWLVISLSRLSAITAYCIVAVGCAIGGALWLFRNRSSFVLDLRKVKGDWWNNWEFGKWVLAERMASTLNESLSSFLLVFLVGTAANGIFAAYISIIAAARPCLLAIGNVLLPKASRAMAQGGIDELRKVISNTARIIALMMTFFCISIIILGRRMVVFIYGTEFATYDRLIVIISIYLFVSSLGLPQNYGLWAMGRSKTLFKIRMIRLLGQLTASAALIFHFGVIGAAYGLLVGGILSTAGTFRAYRAALLGEPARSGLLPRFRFEG